MDRRRVMMWHQRLTIWRWSCGARGDPVTITTSLDKSPIKATPCHSCLCTERCVTQHSAFLKLSARHRPINFMAIFNSR